MTAPVNAIEAKTRVSRRIAPPSTTSPPMAAARRAAADAPARGAEARAPPGPTPRAPDGMAQAEQNGMKRVARAGHHPDQPGRLKNAADPLVAQVGAVVELLEAGGFLEPAREDQSIAVVRRLAAVDSGLDSKLTKAGPV